MENSLMIIVPITSENTSIFDVLVQDYEAEFSAITGKEPCPNGRFVLEAGWEAPYKGFYLFTGDKPAGFAVKGIIDGRSDMIEFYILPCYRKKNFGKLFAFKIFDRFPGPWQVRQIKGAVEANVFWRRIIDEYTHGHYSEDQVNILIESI
jgi:predicted acetyltransferase